MCEVEMAGFWPSCFFACLWAKKESRSINSQKENKAWSIKDLLFVFREIFLAGHGSVIPSGQDSSILPAPVANHGARFGSCCPPTELAIQ